MQKLCDRIIEMYASSVQDETRDGRVWERGMTHEGPADHMRARI